MHSAKKSHNGTDKSVPYDGGLFQSHKLWQRSAVGCGDLDAPLNHPPQKKRRAGVVTPYDGGVEYKLHNIQTFR